MTNLASTVKVMEQRLWLLEHLCDDAQKIIEMKELNPTQRVILHYLKVSVVEDPIHQRELCDKLGLVMKTVRLNLRELHKLGYVIPGTKSYTWEING